jgi:hypothetical protein
VSRDEAGDLVGEFDDAAPDDGSAPASSAEPGPEDSFANVFGSIEEPRP